LPHLKTNVTPLTKLSPELDSDSGLHKLEELVMIALCSLLSGIDDWEAMEDFANDHKSWFQSFLELPNGIPSHDTLSLILGRLNPVMFAQQLSGWMETLLSNLVETGSTLDKKALIAPSEDSPVPVIKAFIDDTPSPEKQPALSVKINSPTSIPAFLELLTLQDAIVMIDIPDSINYDKCQKMLTKAIVAKGGDYILAIKDHPPTLHKDITQGLDSLINQGKLADWKGNEQEEQGYLERRKKDQGRIHRRHYWFSDRIDWLESRREWANLNTLGRMEQSSRIRRKTNIDRRELLCSLKDLKAFSGVVKAHWRNENPHDWVLGIYFTDTGKHSSVLHHAAENIALLRQTSLNLLHRNGTGRQSVEQHHIKARLDDQYRQQLLTGITISR
jgi:predicted transposase YbfD/YdcC